MYSSLYKEGERPLAWETNDKVYEVDKISIKDILYRDAFGDVYVMIRLALHCVEPNGTEKSIIRMLTRRELEELYDSLGTLFGYYTERWEVARVPVFPRDGYQWIAITYDDIKEERYRFHLNIQMKAVKALRDMLYREIIRIAKNNGEIPDKKEVPKAGEDTPVNGSIEEV